MNLQNSVNINNNNNLDKNPIFNSASTEKFPELSTGLITFMNNSFLTDLVIKGNDKGKSLYFPSHKIILAASSKYIQTIIKETIDFPLQKIKEEESKEFTNVELIELPELLSFEELNNININNNNNISMNNTELLITKESLVNILFKYCYSNQNFHLIQNLINDTNVYKLLSLSTSLQIEKLNYELSKYISSKGMLNIENCSRTLKEAIILENEALMDECIKLISSHFDIVINNPQEKKSLIDLPFNVFKKIVSSDDLVLDSEKKICDLVIEYIESRKNINNVIEIENSNKINNEIIGDNPEKVEIDKLEGGKDTNLKAEVVENKEDKPIDEDIEKKEDGKKEEEIKDVDKKEILEKDTKEANINDNKDKKSIVQVQKEKINKLKEIIKKIKLTPEQERELILCIRFSFLTHKELLSITNSETLKDSKDLLLEGISIRLNPYESVENQNTYKINLLARKYSNLVAYTDSKQRFNPVKSYDDNNFKMGNSVKQPQQQLGVQGSQAFGNSNYQSQQMYNKPPQNI